MKEMKRLALRKLIAEELRIKLHEDDAPLTKANDPTMLENDSLDAQVDRILLQADGDKDAGGATTEGLLREAGEDAPPASLPATSAPPQGPAGSIDTVHFCDNVARLVEKAETLLDIRGTIVRRALNYVTKNYDAKQSKEVEQVLEGNFGLRPDSSTDPYEDDVAPPAKGAGSSLQQT